MKTTLLFISSSFFLFCATVANGQTAGTWSTLSSSGLNPRYWCTSGVVNGKIYLIGGNNGTGFDTTVDVYDPATDTWQTLATTGHFTARMALTSCVYNGKIYVMGGCTGPETPAYMSNLVEVFDPSTNAWSTPQTTGTFTPRCVLASAAVNNKFYVIGGFNGSNDLTTMEVFDPATNTWSSPTTSGSFLARGAFPAVVYNNKIYVIGGASNGTLPTRIQVFDPSINEWSTLSTHGSFAGRCDHAVGVIGEKVYVMGGLYGGGFSPITTDAFQVFDLQTNTWSTPTYNGSFMSRGYVTSVVADNQLYVIGGVDTIGGQPYCLGVIQSFDPSTASVDVNHSNIKACTALPNPTSGNVTLTNVPTDARITVENLLGQPVLQINNLNGSSTEVELATLPTGTYYIRILTQSGIIVRKIIKE